MKRAKNIIFISGGNAGQTLAREMAEEERAPEKVIAKLLSTDEIVKDWHNSLRKKMPLTSSVFAAMDIQIRANDDKHFIKKYCAGPRNNRTPNPRRARRIVRRFNKAVNRGYGLSKELYLTFGRLCARIAKKT